MADLPSDFWSGWIVLLTVLSLIGLGWVIYGAYFVDRDTPAVHTVWDENLREGSAPAPMWWFWLMVAAMVFSVIYLMLYPGLGSYAGALQWSQGGRLEESFALYRTEFEARRAAIAEAPLETLQADAAVMSSAAGIYSRNCAACHGPDAAGQADLFPSLVDDAWQWGGEPAQIEQTLRNGRQAVMPGLGSALDDTAVEQVVAYVLALSGDEDAAGMPGESVFATYCSACHGGGGQGNPMLGAPSLADDIWLYGRSEEAIATAVRNGRMGVMPAFGERLDAAQIRMLTAWLTR